MVIIPLGSTIIDLRGFPENGGHELDYGQQLSFAIEHDNAYDSFAVAAKTMEAAPKLIGRAPRAKHINKKCCAIIAKAQDLDVTIHASFMNVFTARATGRGGRRYLEDQVRIRLDFSFVSGGLSTTIPRRKAYLLLNAFKQYAPLQFRIHRRYRKEIIDAGVVPSSNDTSVEADDRFGRDASAVVLMSEAGKAASARSADTAQDTTSDTENAVPSKRQKTEEK